MNSINNYNNSDDDNVYQYYIHLKAEQVVNHLNTYITGLSSDFDVELSELDYDPLYDCALPHDNVSHMWKIELYYSPVEDGYTFIDTFYVVPRYEILIAFKENSGSEPSFIDLTNNSNGRANICDKIIKNIKLRLKKGEILFKNLNIRYAERESYLTLVNGSVTNYNNYDNNTLLQVHAEKNVSKKRQVLENPWFHREMLQFIDL